jgi:hypothetical protein
MKGLGIPVEQPPQDLEEQLDALERQAYDGFGKATAARVIATLREAIKRMEVWNDLASTNDDGYSENEESKADERRELFVMLKEPDNE